MHGVKFFYKMIKNQDYSKTMTEVEGFENYSINDQHFTDVLSLYLDDDEFLIEFGHKNGLIIDSLYFKTSKQRTLKYPNQNFKEQDLFIYKCPQGLHFSNFRTGFGHLHQNEICLTYIGADIFRQSSLQDNQTDNEKQNKKLYSLYKIMKNLISFLSINDILNIFLLNRQFSNLRFDNYILGQLSQRIIYQGIEESRKFVENIVNSDHYKQSHQDQYITQLLNETKNFIPNPSSKKSYILKKEKGLKEDVEEQSFSTSFFESQLIFSKQLSEILNEKQLKALKEAKAGLLFGAKFRTQGPQGTISIKAEINDEQNKNLFIKQLNHITISTSEWKQFLFTYQEKNENINRVIFTIGAKDGVMWAGQFGPRISGIFIRYLPVQTENEKELFQYSVEYENKIMDQNQE